MNTWSRRQWLVNICILTMVGNAKKRHVPCTLVEHLFQALFKDPVEGENLVLGSDKYSVTRECEHLLQVLNIVLIMWAQVRCCWETHTMKPSG